MKAVAKPQMHYVCHKQSLNIGLLYLEFYHIPVKQMLIYFSIQYILSSAAVIRKYGSGLYQFVLFSVHYSYRAIWVWSSSEKSPVEWHCSHFYKIGKISSPTIQREYTSEQIRLIFFWCWPNMQATESRHGAFWAFSHYVVCLAPGGGIDTFGDSNALWLLRGRWKKDWLRSPVACALVKRLEAAWPWMFMIQAKIVSRWQVLILFPIIPQYTNLFFKTRLSPKIKSSN